MLCYTVHIERKTNNIMVTTTKSAHRSLSQDDLTVARDKWFNGDSLVKIAHFFSVTPSVIHYRLKKQFGRDVCSPVKNSLVRGLVRDGYKLDSVRDLPDSDQFYSSHRRDKVYTSHQDTRGQEVMENMAAPEPPEYDESLNLTLFNLLFTCTVTILGAIIND